MNLDYQIFQVINDLAGKNPFWDKIGIFLAEYLPYLIGLGVAVFGIYWLIKNKGWRILLQSAASLILGRGIITEAIRFLWHRPRPFVDHAVNSLISHDATGSFPSGHAAFLFALAAAVYFNKENSFVAKRLGWLFFVLGFLACAARVFVGVHYPSDILAGMAVGIFSGWLVCRISKNVRM